METDSPSNGSVFVVANEPDASTIARWLRAGVAARVRAGEGSDDTLTALARDPADVLILDAGLRAGDALAFVNAFRAEAGGLAKLVLLADELGQVRHPIDAEPFQPDRFMQRPLARSALVFAVRSCLALVRGLDDREQAVADPIEDYLADELEELLGPASSSAASSSAASSSPASRPVAMDPPLALRDATVVLGPVATAAPYAGARANGLSLASEEARTGTFVTALKRHMSAIEARLFGGSDGGGGDDSAPPEIDLDAIAVPPVTGFGTRMGTESGTDLGADFIEPSAPVLTPTPRFDGVARAESYAGPMAGDLGREDLAGLFGRFARERFAGRVLFRRGEVQKTVSFEDGRPVFATSNQRHERMGELLVREGKVTREQIGRAGELVTQSGRRLGEILVDLGFLKRRELLPAVRRHVEDVLYSLFSWESGAYTIQTGTAGRDEKIRLATHASALIVEGIRRKLGRERLHRLVGPPSTVLLPVGREDRGEALAEVELAPEERQVVERFDGERSIAAVVAETALEELGVYQLAYALIAVGRATVGDRAVETAGRVTTASTTWLTGTGDSSIDRERVLAKHAQVLESDYFELLGVRRDASGFEVRRAFEALRRDFAPESFTSDVQRELAVELSDIGRLLVEAHRVLSSDTVRAAYLANLANPDE